jgi:hypothetical protein
LRAWSQARRVRRFLRNDAKAQEKAAHQWARQQWDNRISAGELEGAKR